MDTFEIAEKEVIIETNNNKQSKNTVNNLLFFDISLIDSLESDHRQIYDLYMKVLDSAKNKEYSTLQLTLVEFATAFTNHIQIEDEKLYGYLKKMASNKSNLEQKIVAEFSSEMKNVSISVFSFLSQNPYIPVNENNADSFVKDFEQIGLMLIERIEREEKILYPIYKSSRKVVNIS